MKKEKLTAYDNFIINKSKYDLFANDYEESNNSNIKISEFANKFLIDAEPSNDEISSEKINEENEIDIEIDKNSAKRSITDTRVYDNTHFKKFGKIFLCIYVIIMLALALIVLVKTTITDNVTNADAATPIQNDEDSIEVMEDEEHTDNDDWFDNLCDSLK